MVDFQKVLERDERMYKPICGLEYKPNTEYAKQSLGKGMVSLTKMQERPNPFKVKLNYVHDSSKPENITTYQSKLGHIPRYIYIYIYIEQQVYISEVTTANKSK